MNLNLQAKEERANAITHAVGIVLSIVALITLVRMALLWGTTWHLVSYSIYGASMIMLYSASTAFHGQRNLRRKVQLNKFDHAAIYLLIAGTYTPFTLVVLHGFWGWLIFGIVWTMAIAGIIFKIWFYSKRYRRLSAMLYLAMGWVGIIAAKPMVENLGHNSLVWLLVGGAFYSLGVLFYLRQSRPFFHTIFHLFIIVGSAAHFLSIYYFL